MDSVRTVHQKYLFEKRPHVPDNHVDDSFLAALVTNANVQTYGYWTVVKNTVPVIQQITAVTIFLCIFIFALNKDVSVMFLGALDVTVALLGGILAAIPERSIKAKVISKSAGTVYLLTGTLVVLAPVMRTLTKSYSNDTVTFLVMLLCSLHLFFHDYTITARITGSGMFSLNAGIFASVLLASRLSSNEYVFVFLCLATELLVFFPSVRKYIMESSEHQNMAVAAVMLVVAFSLLLSLSTVLAVVYVTGVAFIGFVCPLGLISVQKYKCKISGPWDIAKVKALS